MKLDNLSASQDYLSFLLKGSWGFGKTVAAATFARLGPVHLSYWDKKGPIELVQFFKKYEPSLLKNIEYDIYSSRNAHEFLNKYIEFANGRCPYVAEINDSVTTMTSAAVNWSLGFNETKKKKPNPNTIAIPDFDEYKVETSLVTQALDIARTLPCHIIWIAHPLPSMKIEGTGNTMRVSKVNSIVTYGSKVAGIVPGQFSEIYHFSKQSNWDAQTGKSKTKYIVSTEQVGDDYAKSNIGLNVEMDITDKLFYDVWKEEVKKLEAKLDEVKSEPVNPFASMKTTDVKANVTKFDPNKKPWEQ